MSPAEWETLESSKLFVNTHRFSFANLRDGSNRVKAYYEVTGTPSMRLLDKHGDELRVDPQRPVRTFREVEELLDGLE